MAKAELVPLVDAARRLRVSWSPAWRLVLIGELVARQEGGRWLVEESSLRERERATLAASGPMER
jgi:ABC-type nitrate/sulfonate/bicarbonate transport system permease component